MRICQTVRTTSAGNFLSHSFASPCTTESIVRYSSLDPGGIEMKNLIIGAIIWVCLSLAACTSQKTNGGVFGPMSDTSSLTTKNMEAVKGQKATCAGPSVKTFNLDLIETNVSLGMGTSFAAWTYNGRIPAPVIEA